MQRFLVSFIAVIAVAAACAGETYSGVIRTESGKGARGCEVTAFRNSWAMMIPFTYNLPLNLGSTRTDSNGHFSLTTQKKASFLMFDGRQGYGSIKVGASQRDIRITLLPRSKR